MSTTHKEHSSECTVKERTTLNGEDYSGKASTGGEILQDKRNHASSTSLSANSAPLHGAEASTASTDVDASLDERLVSALNELELPKSSSRSLWNGSILADRTMTTAQFQSNASGSDSDEEGEVSPHVLGYMPLPSQDPDIDSEVAGEECSTPPLQESIQSEEEIPSRGERPAIPEASGIGMTVVDLKKDEVEAIKEVMSGFSLPTSVIPEWAKQVPEEVWKTELLDGLKKKKKS